jgi:hypothetical protein
MTLDATELVDGYWLADGCREIYGADDELGWNNVDCTALSDGEDEMVGFKLS